MSFEGNLENHEAEVFQSTTSSDLTTRLVTESGDGDDDHDAGPITDAFSHCTGLRSLDLSSNDLDGQIPDSLTSLESLTYFNVSFNQLSGPVPSSGPFANFNSGSYLGNPELCGSALPKNCRSSCSGISCHDRLWIVIVPAVAGGSVAGLVLAAVWFLLVAKRGDSRGTIAPVVPNASPFTREIEGLGLADIVAATNGFSDDSIIGVGSKSTVFAGVLPSGVMIAVKRLELRSDDRATAQLCRELQVCSPIHSIRVSSPLLLCFCFPPQDLSL